MMKTKNYFLAFFCLFSFTLFAQQDCDLDWRYTTYGQLPGLRSMTSADLDGDNIPEIFVNTKGALGWYIMNYNPTTDSYEKIWTSPPTLEKYISQITLIDWDEDGDLEIFASDSYGDTRIYDGITKEEIGFFDLPTSDIHRLLFADADNDGEKEFIASSEYNGFIVNKSTFSIEYTFGMPTRDIAVGQVDGDPDLEIITAEGDVYQMNGSTINLEWNALDIDDFNNIRHIELIQIDEDAAMEIVIAYNWNLHILDAEEQLVKYEGNSNDGRISELLVYQNLSTGRSEIYTGTAGGSIINYSIDLSTQVKSIDGWALNLDGICGFTFTDANNDGQINVVMGEGCGSSGGQHIQIYDLESSELKWKSVDIDGPFTSLVYIEETDKIISSSSSTEGGYGYNALVEIDAKTGKELKLDLDNFADYNFSGIQMVQLSPNHSNQLLAYGGYNAILMDPTTYQIQKSKKDEIFRATSATAADLDNDGVKEILIGDATGLKILDDNLTLINSISLNFDITTEVIAVNIDQDDALEIIFSNRFVHVYDDDLTILWRSFGSITDVAVTDWDGNGIMDVIATDEYGSIKFYDLKDYEEFNSISIGYEDIDKIELVDLNEDGNEELIVVTEGAIYIIDENEQPVALKQDDAFPYYAVDFLEFADLDEDGKKEIIYANDFSISALNGNCYKSFLITAIEDIALDKQEITVYPNPVLDILTVETTNLEDYKISIKDINGKIISAQTNSHQISLSYLPEGMYFVTVTLDKTGTVFTKKVIKL